MITPKNQNMSAMIEPWPYSTSTPVINDYDTSSFIIDGQRFDGSVAIVSDEAGQFHINTCVTGDPACITPDDMALFATPDLVSHLVVIGVGEAMTHPFYPLRQKLATLCLKGEILPTGAACRTWNLLLSEGRKVAFIAIPAIKERGG